MDGIKVPNVDGIQIPNVDERVRVLNLIQMYENGSLTPVPGQPLRVAALLCKTVVNIRKINRSFINQLRERDWRPFTEGNYPEEGEEILARLHDEHIVITLFGSDDIEDMQNEGIENWLRIPKFNKEEKL